jgi:stress-induced-phosphoprotein 1
MSAQEWKEKGNAFLKNKDYEEALKCYTEAVNREPTDHIHYSNRSVCHYNMGNFEKALEDANSCIGIKPDWGKGYLRKGMAELKLNKTDEAELSYKKGLELEPNNQQLKDGLNEIEMVSKNPFAKNYSKLYTDPRTMKYMQDPQFRTLLEYGMKDQKMLMELVSKDPRFMDVFSVLTGLDLTKMGEDEEKRRREKEAADKERKKKEDEDRVKAEAERVRKEEEERYLSMSPEEKELETRRKQAEEAKAKGNEEFKKKNWEEAIKLYSQAIDLNPKELTFYLNRAGAYHEVKNYEKTIEDCNFVLENTFDFQKKARAHGRIAFAYQEQGDLDKAVEHFERSLLENTDQRIKDALKQVNEIKKKQEAESYINPELGEEHNAKANELYKAGKYPDALKEYNEALRRDPKNIKFYTNRATCYIKLMEFASAAKDCDKALELDPNSLRAYQRKASCHTMLKEYHRAMDTYEKGLKIFPEDKELKEGYTKTMNQINYGGGDEKDNEERRRHAMADPEIQKLLKDPRIQQLFKDLQENPKSANDAIMKDEFIAGAFKKLVAAGFIQTR